MGIRALGPSFAESLQFQDLEAYRPLAERAPELQIAEARRREFFNQLHRWLRQGYAVHVFCNNDGERQRFEEIWQELGLGSGVSVLGTAPHATQPQDLDAKPQIQIGTLSRGFLCDEAKLVVVTDAEIFGRYKIQRPRRLKSPHALATRSALDIDFTELEEGDLVVHLQYGIGRFLGLKNLPASSRAETPDARSRTPDARYGMPRHRVRARPFRRRTAETVRSGDRGASGRQICRRRQGASAVEYPRWHALGKRPRNRPNAPCAMSPPNCCKSRPCASRSPATPCRRLAVAARI